MIRLILAALTVILALYARGNELLQVYWTLVCAYWVTNYIDARRRKHE